VLAATYVGRRETEIDAAFEPRQECVSQLWIEPGAWHLRHRFGAGNGRAPRINLALQYSIGSAVVIYA
jgi:hypothetical protein